MVEEELKTKDNDLEDDFSQFSDDEVEEKEFNSDMLVGELNQSQIEEINPSNELKVEQILDSEADIPQVPFAGDKKKPAVKRWYIVHTYSGHENKVKVNLEKRIEFMNMGDKIFRVEVPEKTVSKVKDGRRVDKDERLFPGYVLVEMKMDDDSWYVVRHTPGVTKFVGAERKPIPAKDSEIKKILRRTQTKVTKVEIDIRIGDKVRIISGPFADFVGDVTEVYPDKEKLRANVSIFGRDTPVELEYNQIQKV